MSQSRLKRSPHNDTGIYYEADFETWHININAEAHDGPFTWLVDIGMHTIQSGDRSAYATPALAYSAALTAAGEYFRYQMIIALNESRPPIGTWEIT